MPNAGGILMGATAAAAGYSATERRRGTWDVPGNAQNAGIRLLPRQVRSAAR
jgi:hypothetical protein